MLILARTHGNKPPAVKLEMLTGNIFNFLTIFEKKNVNDVQDQAKNHIISIIILHCPVLRYM